MSELLPLWDRIRNRARELNPPIAPNIDLVETIVRDELEAVKQFFADRPTDSITPRWVAEKIEERQR